MMFINGTANDITSSHCNWQVALDAFKKLALKVADKGHSRSWTVGHILLPKILLFHSNYLYNV